MTNVRLPQTRAEIDAVVEHILWKAWCEPFSRPERNHEKRLASDRELLQQWLGTVSRLGALSKPELITRAMVAVGSGSDELQVFGGFRVVTEITRRQWVGGPMTSQARLR